MSLGLVSSMRAGIVSTQPKKESPYVLSERPKHDDSIDKFVKQKADEAKNVPVKERTAGNWASLVADFLHNTVMKPPVLSEGKKGNI